MTVRDALAEGAARLAASGIENPRLDAALLMAGVLGTGRSALLPGSRLSESGLGGERLAAFDRLLERRLAGECVAYILGRKEFFGLDFAVDPSVLVPRPDSEILVEAALECLAGISGRAAMLDLCTGSGAIAIAVAATFGGRSLEVWATDLSPAALETARVNGERLVPGLPIRFLPGDLFRALEGRSPPRFDLIAANPPYLRSGDMPGLAPEVRREPALALDGGPDGLDLIARIVAGAGDFLRPGGSLLIEADPEQMPAIAGMLDAAGFGGICARRDLGGRERVIGAGFGSLDRGRRELPLPA